MDRAEEQPLLDSESHPSQSISGERHPYSEPARRQVRRFLSSRYGHYAVLLLVTVDVGCIFADFLISLYICDIKCSKGQAVDPALPKAQEALGIVSLVFSCLFMVELLASIWALGGEYFKSWFRCLDGTIILAGFVIDVCLKGVLEEAGSVIVILRFWRVFKIVEEFSAGASDQMDAIKEQMEALEVENKSLRKRVRALDSASGD